MANNSYTIPLPEPMAGEPQMPPVGIPIAGAAAGAAIAAPAPTPAMTSDQMKTDLAQMYEGVKSKERIVNSRGLMDKNALRNMKNRLTETFFEFMQKMGVNLNDLGSINQFLGELQRIDPDLYELFAIAFDGLIKDEEIGLPSREQPATEPNVEAGLGSRFQNLQQQMLRQQ